MKSFQKFRNTNETEEMKIVRKDGSLTTDNITNMEQTSEQKKDIH